jgi:drug/metabolite transporter (DMT)-like permease
VSASSKNVALIALLSVIWGTAFLFIDLGLDDFSPFLFAALRFDIAGPLLLAAAFLWLGRDAIPRGRAQWQTVLVTSVFNIFAYHALVYWGQLYTLEAIAAVIVGLNPIAATAFSRLLLKDERLGRYGAVGLAIGLAGIVVLELLRPGALLNLQGWAELAIALGVSCWALGAVVSRRLDHKMPAATLTAWQMLLGAVLLHAFAFAVEGGGRMEWTTVGTASLLYLALLSSGFGYFLFFFLVPRVGAIRTTVVSTLTPISATVAGVIVLADPVEPRMLIAFALIVVSFLMVTEPWKERAPRPSQGAGAPAPASEGPPKAT